MIIPYLVPRLNYKFSLSDFVISLYGIFKTDPDMTFMNSLFGSGNIYFVNHARTGLRLLLTSLQLGPNAKIGVQAYNCHTVFKAIQNAGLNPIFIDVNSDFQIDTCDLERKKDNLEALIVTHTFGIPADMQKIQEIIPDKPIIEDCAHGFLSRYKNKLVGTFGDAAIFSMGKGKFPSIGPGGFVVINNEALKARFSALHDRLPRPGLLNEFQNIFKSTILHFLHNPYIYALFTSNILKQINAKKDISGNYSHTETKILRSSQYLFYKRFNDLGFQLDKQIQLMRELSRVLYNEALPDIFVNRSLALNGFMLPVMISNNEEIFSELKARGIEIGRHFSKSIEWAKEYGYINCTCPNAENIAKNVLVFPCHYNYRQTKTIINAMRT